MEKFLFLFVHLVLPILILFDFLKRKPQTKIGLVVKSTMMIGVLIFLYNWGQWPLVWTYYFRYALLVLCGVILLRSLLIFKSLDDGFPTSMLKRLSLFFVIAILGVTIVANFFTIMGQNYFEEGVELDFPLKNGTFYVASGGTSKFINNHMRDYPNAQQYAIDINRLDNFKRASKGLFSNTNTDHYIYGDSLFCPCNGIINEVENKVRDNDSGGTHITSQNGLGNYVNIKCAGEIMVLIPHLMQYSVSVIKGENVEKGKFLGLIGISGFSQEPHLHIQAPKFNKDSKLVGIPIKFQGTYYSRNDIIVNK